MKMHMKFVIATLRIFKGDSHKLHEVTRVFEEHMLPVVAFIVKCDYPDRQNLDKVALLRKGDKKTFANNKSFTVQLLY